MSIFSLFFLTRSGCHLCQEAEPMVRRLAAEVAVRVEARDIDADQALLDDYTDRIPVVLGPSGQVLAEGIIDERSLREALAIEIGKLRPG